jgi:hypothetical protein
MAVAGGPVGVNAEGVPTEAGEDVQAKVKDLLEGDRSVGEEDVDALTAQTGTA